ncbi:MAG: hypothetical protein KTR30_17585 [Saprospiraceae bacterium]|nr:hypothetical protein [Saprospiraceae bacterium]
MSEELFQKLGQELAESHRTVAGQMFGKPCLKINRKAFVASFQGEMVFKLGQKRVELLKEKYIGSVNWDPSGKNRAMKDWLQVPTEYSEDWHALAKEALAFTDTGQ